MIKGVRHILLQSPADETEAKQPECMSIVVT